MCTFTVKNNQSNFRHEFTNSLSCRNEMPEASPCDHWSAFYQQQSILEPPSAFARFVAESFLQNENQSLKLSNVNRRNSKKYILDVACGTGRDSLFFAESGYDVIGVDLSAQPLVKDQTTSKSSSWRFVQGDMGKLHLIQEPSCFADPEFFFDAIYFRFCLHSVPPDVQTAALRYAHTKLAVNNGVLCIEARSVKDDLYGKGVRVGEHAYEATTKQSPAHYRRFIVLDDLVLELKQLGFSMLFVGEQNGWAEYGNEDPVVVRVVAKREV